MACSVRLLHGSCLHSQCPHPHSSTYECVEMHEGCCECSGTCPVTVCKFNVPVEKADAAFARYYKEEW